MLRVDLDLNFFPKTNIILFKYVDFHCRLIIQCILILRYLFIATMNANLFK